VFGVLHCPSGLPLPPQYFLPQSRRIIALPHLEPNLFFIDPYLTTSSVPLYPSKNQTDLPRKNVPNLHPPFPLPPDILPSPPGASLDTSRTNVFPQIAPGASAFPIPIGFSLHPASQHRLLFPLPSPRRLLFLSVVVVIFVFSSFLLCVGEELRSVRSEYTTFQDIFLTLAFVAIWWTFALGLASWVSSDVARHPVPWRLDKISLLCGPTPCDTTITVWCDGQGVLILSPPLEYCMDMSS